MGLGASPGGRVKHGPVPAPGCCRPPPKSLVSAQHNPSHPSEGRVALRGKLNVCPPVGKGGRASSSEVLPCNPVPLGGVCTAYLERAPSGVTQRPVFPTKRLHLSPLGWALSSYAASWGSKSRSTRLPTQRRALVPRLRRHAISRASMEKCSFI